jgi:SNF2 family DNA or RNA helicase
MVRLRPAPHQRPNSIDNNWLDTAQFSVLVTDSLPPARVQIALAPSRRALSFSFAPQPDGWQPASSEPTELHPIPLVPGFDFEPSRIAAAVRWVIDLDTQSKQRFLDGKRVTKDVPLADPPPLPSPGESAGTETYWRLRRPSGELIRPLLLASTVDDHLFPYQEAGVAWLMGRRVGILADDMGLGKTLEAITAMKRLLRSGLAREFVVVCPKTLLANWEAELLRWAPELSRLRVIPERRLSKDVWESIVGRVHVIVTNYEQLRTPPPALLHELPVLVADEAHKVRNMRALTTKGMSRLPYARFWALTGTPIERDPRDLATLLSIMEPARFAVSDAAMPAGVLRARAKPYILRRLKSDVLSQLPRVLESVEALELTPAQWRSYMAALAERLRPDANPGAVLGLMNRLRTICDYDPDTGHSVKADRIVEILENVHASGEKAVVFSYLLEPLRSLQVRLNRSLGPETSVLIEGSMSTPDRESSLRAFRERAKVVVLLASSRVGSEGLTLTEANHVIFFNEWWNPSANAQARDRVVRIGQQKGVRVYKFRCRNTIEEALDRILTEKSLAFESIIDRLADASGGSGGETAPLIEDISREIVTLAAHESRNQMP